MRTHRWARIALSAAGLVLAATAPVLGTNGTRLTASGARAGGRGGTDTAIADDATALNTNPAGIGFIDGQRFDSAMAIIRPSVRWQTPNDDTSTRLPPIGGIVGGAFGVVVDFDEPWHLGEALGFGEETPSENPSRTDAAYSGTGLKIGFGVFPVVGNYMKFLTKTPFWNQQPVPWEEDSKEAAVTLGLAWRLFRWLSLGVSPQFITGLPGGYKQFDQDSPLSQPVSILQGRIGNTNLRYADAAPFLGTDHITGFSDLHDVSTFGFRLRTGLLCVPAEWEWGRWSLGASYATQTWKQDFLGTVTVDFTDQINHYSPGQRTALQASIAADTGIPPNQQSYRGDWNIRGSPLDQPQEVSVGSAEQLWFGDVGVTFATDVTWLNWSSTFKKFSARLSDGTSRELNELTGSSTVHIDVPLDWDDQFVFAFGVSVAPVDWLVLRAGYNYGKNQHPSNTLQPTIPAILEHHVTCGASFEIRRLELTLSYEHAFSSHVRIDDSIANPDLDGSDITVSVDSLALGIGVRF